MSIYIEEWRLELLQNPPRSAQMFSQEEWEYIVLNELTSASLFYGESNGNFGNPTEYKHSEYTRNLISDNNAKYWKGKNVPWAGSKRPDSVEIARAMGLANNGKTPWNKGLTGVQTVSEDTKLKMSLAKMGKPKPKIKCPHCGKEGGQPQMKQWHFDNCKRK